MTGNFTPCSNEVNRGNGKAVSTSYELRVFQPDHDLPPDTFQRDDEIECIAQKHRGKFDYSDSADDDEFLMVFTFETLEQVQAAAQEMKANHRTITDFVIEVHQADGTSYVLPGEDGVGYCYSTCANWMLRNGADAEEALLVHGYPTLVGGPAKGNRFGHAWIEVGGSYCLDGNRLQKIPLQRYYREGNIDPESCHKYTFAEVVRLLTETGHAGPWHEPPSDAVFGGECPAE
jgi:hypothetical protein